MMRVRFKHEDVVDGTPVGPVFVYDDEDTDSLTRPFDPDREPDPWVALHEAEAIAAEHGVELEQD